MVEKLVGLKKQKKIDSEHEQLDKIERKLQSVVRTPCLLQPLATSLCCCIRNEDQMPLASNNVSPCF